jgi:hypothetical protein
MFADCSWQYKKIFYVVGKEIQKFCHIFPPDQFSTDSCYMRHSLSVPHPVFPLVESMDKSRMKETEQPEALFFVHLNMLNAGTKGVNAAISSRKHISATLDEGASGGE